MRLASDYPLFTLRSARICFAVSMKAIQQDVTEPAGGRVVLQGQLLSQYFDNLVPRPSLFDLKSNGSRS